MISSVFIDRPRLAIVIAIVISLGGPVGAHADPGRAAPRYRAAPGRGHGDVPWRVRGGARGDGGAAAGVQDRRRRQDDLHEEHERQ